MQGEIQANDQVSNLKQDVPSTQKKKKKSKKTKKALAADQMLQNLDE